VNSFQRLSSWRGRKPKPETVQRWWDTRYSYDRLSNSGVLGNSSPSGVRNLGYPNLLPVLNLIFKRLPWARAK